MAAERATPEFAEEKLDAALFSLYKNGQLVGRDKSESRLAVIVRCRQGTLDQVLDLISRLGGSVEDIVKRFNLIGALLAPGLVLELAEKDAVTEVALEGQHTIA